jgi:hypothetical protein
MVKGIQEYISECMQNTGQNRGKIQQRDTKMALSRNKSSRNENLKTLRPVYINKFMYKTHKKKVGKWKNKRKKEDMVK